ncbi:hypothetical protein L1987_11495 [Smallanthus sonchifolius]|uniref:Uncharacterized protein n=1 Tax=Smallanthus sonchifolius TaxID=185202 RepID=A0ACB9JDD7_9ASTR|nr:hypothetical protein L1987_11495 [Smallanthus sonchifolius]
MADGSASSPTSTMLVSSTPARSGSQADPLVDVSSGSYREDSQPISSILKKRPLDDASGSSPAKRASLKFRLRSNIHKLHIWGRTYLNSFLPFPEMDDGIIGHAVSASPRKKIREGSGKAACSKDLDLLSDSDDLVPLTEKQKKELF